MTEEQECPCEDASRISCTTCQDLPPWYFNKKEYIAVTGGPVSRPFGIKVTKEEMEERRK